MLAPDQAWKPLPVEEWDYAAARHLAARLGFSINPGLVDFIHAPGPRGALGKLLGQIQAFPPPPAIAEIREEMSGMRGQYDGSDPEQQREMRQAMQRQQRGAYQDFAIAWYDHARAPANSAQEKLVLFFQDVWVVAFNGVRNSDHLYDHQNRIRTALGSTYPQMCKSLAVSPAMVRYLNLAQNRKGSPNENFARELFELFCLGEGNYTEQDIKEAARALTGFGLERDGKVQFRQARHDAGRKTIFGSTANFNLESLIDLVFRQPAASRFLPGELARYYLADEPLGQPVLEELGRIWRDSGYSIPVLVTTFFNSRLFYESEFRGNQIKSPVHFYLGLMQDLDLDVFPSPRRTESAIRSMGQPFFNPPNVRGWVGGRHWINSATLSARRQLVQNLLEPVPRGRLNADEIRALERAEADGKARFSLSQDQLRQLAEATPGKLAAALANRFHVNPRPAELEPLFTNLQSSHKGLEWARACLAAALTTPPYHLC